MANTHDPARCTAYHHRSSERKTNCTYIRIHVRRCLWSSRKSCPSHFPPYLQSHPILRVPKWEFEIESVECARRSRRIFPLRSSAKHVYGTGRFQPSTYRNSNSYPGSFVRNAAERSIESPSYDTISPLTSSRGCRGCRSSSSDRSSALRTKWSL